MTPAESFWTPYVRRLAAAGCAALLSGLVTGLAARLAMHLLAARNPQTAGHVTDDGFLVGQVTLGGTVQLLGAVWQAALTGAVVYLIIRPLLIGPTWLRLATAAVGGGVTVGALLVAPDSFDFQALDPPLMPVALFVAVPCLHLAVFGPLVERWLADESWFMRAPVGRVRATLLGWLAGGASLLLLLPMIGICAAVLKSLRGRRPAPRTVAAATWAGRAVLLAIFLGAVANLVSDVDALTGPY